VPQTTGPISAANWAEVHQIVGTCGETLLFNKCFRLSIRALVAKIWPDKVVRWWPDGEFLTPFCVPYFQPAACSTFQTCILNSRIKTLHIFRTGSLESTKLPTRLVIVWYRPALRDWTSACQTHHIMLVIRQRAPSPLHLSLQSSAVISRFMTFLGRIAVLRT